MPANITDKITSTTTAVGTRPTSTIVSTVREEAGTTLSCEDLTGWPTATAVHFVTYKVDGNGDVVAGSQSDWKGIVSSNDITSLTLTGGSDNGNTVGDYVEMLPTAAWGKDLTDVLLTILQQTGGLKNDAVSTDVIEDDAVTEDKIEDGAVTSEKQSNTIGFLVRRTTDQAGIPSGVATKVQFATEVYDGGADFDPSTNYRFTAPVEGLYHFSWDLHLDSIGTIMESFLIVNSTVVAKDTQYSNATNDDLSSGASIDVPLQMGDTVEVRVAHNAGSDRTLLGSDTGSCYFSGYLVGRAEV